jgi:hypothetical protein
MATIVITRAARAALLHSRTLDDSERKALKAEVFADLRRTWDIPSTIKLKVEIDDAQSTKFMVLCDTNGAACLSDGERWTGQDTSTATAATPAPDMCQPFRVSLADLRAANTPDLLADPVPVGFVGLHADGTLLIASQ